MRGNYANENCDDGIVKQDAAIRDGVLHIGGVVRIVQMAVMNKNI